MVMFCFCYTFCKIYFFSLYVVKSYELEKLCISEIFSSLILIVNKLYCFFKTNFHHSSYRKCLKYYRKTDAKRLAVNLLSHLPCKYFLRLSSVD